MLENILFTPENTQLFLIKELAPNMTPLSIIYSQGSQINSRNVGKLS